MTHAERIRRQVRKGKVLQAVDGHITAREVAERVDMPVRTVRQYLADLSAEGELRQVDQRRCEHGGGPARVYALDEEGQR